MNRIQLGNAVFEGLNDVYVFGADADTTTLVDTGTAASETREALSTGLADLGVELADIDQILLTHWHEDHAGFASEIQDESDAVVRVHTADAPLVAGDTDAWEAMEGRQRALLDEWGVPEEPREELLGFLDGYDGLSGRARVESFEGGERFSTPEGDLEALHLPGHAAGLSGFVFEGADGRELLSGDALLPHYTPNVGGADVRVERPLAKYLDTLVRIIDGEFVRAWPGHRDVIEDPAGRARDIAAHHRERTENVLDVLREDGPADAWTVSSHLFGELSHIHILHGPGEAYAHLDHLSAHDVVESTDDGYRLVESDPDLDELFPDISE
ncbi:MBL fold metallo-hydrolase [Halococcus hamelinensis]|uniref:Zn-dependent hydrolase, glyoxylase n=1 Tax=Halococcus hamelinensis 100A6 TaxID=1132509 RepID=M0M769_9EURY|nr:MBL fold metallo-hydrolase [Halococcus hamelinensis]EMA41248.1 zn-dependent hydrolase, glyoxylase [Halococcus hamelinensis 100A6]